MRIKLIAVVAVLGLSGSAQAQRTDYGISGHYGISGQFLSLSSTTALTRATQNIHVGLRDRPPEKAQGTMPDAGMIWFAGDLVGADRVKRRYWTDGSRCPAAVAELRKVEMLSTASPRIPLEGGLPDGGSVRDGTWYILDVDRSVLDGQSTPPIRIQSNVGTSLATWAQQLMAALTPCWSEAMPSGVRMR